MTSKFFRVLSLSLLMLLAACGQHQDDLALQRRALQQRTRELVNEFGPCPRTSTSAMAALRADSRCLIFKTPENPQEPGGRQLALQVMVVPAVRALPEPDPFVILVGGPGQAATVDGLAVLPVFQRIRQDRDILLIDQRGTGPLSPLDCKPPENDDLLNAGADLLLQVQSEFLQSCLASVDADPRYYTTDFAVADLEAIRAYLGYGQLNLWGASYGTRVALMYLKYQPDHVRTVVIDGVAPPGILPLEAAKDGGRALQRLLDMCREETNCSTAFPDLQAHYDELMARYTQPQSISIANPSTGESKPMLLSAGVLQGALFSMLYSRETARLIPLTIERAHAGYFSTLAALNGATDSINALMHFSVICSEDVPRIDSAELAAAVGTFVYDSLVQPRIEGCKVWPSREMPDDYFEPVVSDKPVLLFSATQDPVTPRRWADQVAATLSNSVNVEARGIGHGVYAYGCAASLIADVVDAGSVQELDTSCLDELGNRPFFVNLNGSVVGDDQGR